MLSLSSSYDIKPLPFENASVRKTHSPQSSLIIDYNSKVFGDKFLPAVQISHSQFSHVRIQKYGIYSMANQRRMKMVAQQIQRELADMLLRDQVLRDAMTPEASLGADMYLSSIATISDVEISGDLQIAKVYLSVYGDERGQELAIEGLQSRSKYVRAGLGKRMKLRTTPEIRFILDESLERGSRVLSILSELKDEREKLKRGEKVVRKGIIEDEEDFYGDEAFDDVDINAKKNSKA